MARTQVGAIAQPTLRPVASPVDSFVNPRAGQGLAQVAKALGDLAPSLQNLAQQQIEEEKKRGQTDATSMYEDIKATGKKIKAGEIAPHESKWYQAAAREQVGRLMAAAYGQDLQFATQTDETLSESIDPQDFDTFESQARQKWLEEKADLSDPAFRAGFNATSAQGIMNARQSFVAAAANRMDGRVLDNTYTEHQVSIQAGIEGGKTIEEIAATIRDRNSVLYIVNPKLGKALSKTTIEAVFDAARAFENPELLKVLDHIEGGTPGSKLGQTRAAMSKRDEVEREIRVNRQNRLAAEEKDQKRDRLKIVGGVYEKAFTVLTQDPNADVTEFAKALSAVDRSEVTKMYRVAQAFAKAANVDDRDVRNGLYSQAFTGELTRDEVNDAFVEGLLTPETSLRLMAQIRANESGSRTSGKVASQHPDYTQAESDLKEMVIKQYGDVGGPRYVAARQQMNIEWVDYLSSPEGSAASERDRLKWLNASVYRNFIRTAEPGSAGLTEIEKIPLPPMTGFERPELPNWKTEPVIAPGGYGIESFALEVAGIKGDTKREFSSQAKSLIATYGLTGKDIDEFIRLQRIWRKLRQP